jgi:Lrp/AsnC family transcriptional regulator, leucine-responsive regulatory protein
MKYIKISMQFFDILTKFIYETRISQNMAEITAKDRQILFHLSLNGRASLTEIGKRTRLSKEVVHYRIRRMEQQGIIEGYYAVINTYKIGQTFYRVYMKTANMTPEIEIEFIRYLKEHPKVTWLVQVDGDLDFLYVVWGKDISEFEVAYNEINNKFGKYIDEKYFSVMTNIYYFKYKYLLDCESDENKLTGGTITSAELDDLDMRLLSLLSIEGRLQILEIAKRLGANAKTIQRKMRNLQKKGIITSYNVKINHKKLGYAQRKVMLNLNDTSRMSLNKLITFLTKHRYAIYVTIAIGQYDLEFEMMEKSHQEFHTILKELKTNFPKLIKNYFTVIFYDEPKVGQLRIEDLAGEPIRIPSSKSDDVLD